MSEAVRSLSESDSIKESRVESVHEVSDLPKEGRWITRPRKAMWAPQMFGAFLLLAQGPNLLRIWFGSGPWASVVRLIQAISFALLGAVMVYAFVQRWGAARPRKEDAAIVDDLFGDQYLVEVTIVVEDRRLGTDRGVMWFGDGLMGFSGRASSFVLAAHDLAPECLVPPKVGLKPMPGEAIRLVRAPRPSYLVLTPVAHQRKAFLFRFGQFLGKGEDPGGERYWPPLVPYRESPTFDRAIG